MVQVTIISEVKIITFTLLSRRVYKTGIFLYVQLLKLYEHLAAPLAEAAVLFTSEYGCRNFIREVVRELDAEFYSGNPPKGCSQFLVELAQLSPNNVLPVVDSIEPHLENDVSNQSYSYY